jgi:hypothetical protein
MRDAGTARFYFHLRERWNYLLDHEGVDLCDLDEVMREALRCARSILAAERMVGKRSVGSVVEVEDEAGRPVVELSLARVRALDGQSVSR